MPVSHCSHYRGTDAATGVPVGQGLSGAGVEGVGDGGATKGFAFGRGAGAAPVVDEMVGAVTVVEIGLV
jgi:hypothetical protein